MSHFCFWVPSITCLGINARYNGPDFLRTPGRCSSHSLNKCTGSLSPLSVDHICWEERRVGFLISHCLVFVGFSWILQPCSHLPFGKCSVKSSTHASKWSCLPLKLSPSSRRDFWNLRVSGLLGFPSLSSAEKIASSVLLYGCALFAGFYLSFPWRRSCFAFASSVSCDFVNSRPVIWCSLDSCCDEDSDLWLPALLSTSRARSLYHRSSLFQRKTCLRDRQELVENMHPCLHYVSGFTPSCPYCIHVLVLERCFWRLRFHLFS